MDRDPIRSPIDVDEGGWRGRVMGVTRIGAKAGFTAALILAVLFGLFVYGISTAGHRRAANAAGVGSVTKASEQKTPWWSNAPDARTILRLPSPMPTLSASPRTASPTSAKRVPAVAAAQVAFDAGRERRDRAQALTDAAAGAPVLVRLNDIAPPALAGTPQPALSALLPQAAARGASPNVTAPQLSSGQDERVAFLASAANAARDRLFAARQDDPSAYELHAGSIIPATLLTGINADLPGTIVGQVRSDVFDSVTGRQLLIPRGTRLVGTYDSHVVQGERRVMVAWTRLLFPDGSSLDLSGMAGTDPAGYAGFGANVDEHLNKVFTSALLLGIIGAGAQLSQPQQATSIYAAPSGGQTIAGSLGQQIGNTSIQLTQRQLQVPPTLEVPPGYLFNVLVDRDIVLATPYGGAP
jgi:type IV secretory pathway VirB10-like protein